ncbi:MAG TPA: cysteine desulfurase family protein [Myxococcaceae bacterium]|jgi:cysteine desulfurase
MSAPPIYLDFNATTPVDPAVLEAMLPFLRDRFGNPSSAHAYGRAAAEALARARAQVAALLEAAPEEVVFTSCATESINLAVKGIAFARRAQGRHLVLSAVEHPAAAEACAYLAREHGFEVTAVPVETDGRVDPARLLQAVRDDTALVTLIHAQNETGALQPVQEVGEALRARGVPFHVDASQSAGKVPLSVRALACDALSLAGHKLYAPKGVGALWVRKGLSLHPLLHGAPYEGGRRGGTANVPHAVALGAACELSVAWLGSDGPELQWAMRDRLQEALEAATGASLNGPEDARLPNTLNVSFPGVIGNELLEAAPEIAASTGSACHAGTHEPSGVLLAMGRAPEDALGAVRLSLGRSTTEEEMYVAAAALERSWKRLRR